MRKFTYLLTGWLVVCLFTNAFSQSGNEIMFTGSTPANTVVRAFLDIPLSDSIDFIRWKLVLSGDDYELQCNYGIAQPNTNGFINGGIKVALKGEYRKEKNRYQFNHRSKKLQAVELNANLLHLLNEDKSPLVGNAGWSYTLNNTKPLPANQVNIPAAPVIVKDSMAFEGRTPCHIPGITVSSACYKIKWSVVFYANAKTNEPGTYRINGTAWRKEGGRKGSWRIVTTPAGQKIYQLNDDKGKAYLHLAKFNEHILLFTDAQGELLVGDEDFSYTLNRKW